MQVRYNGPEDAAEIFGCVFKRGEVVDVADAHAIAKLRHHTQFTVVTDVVEIAPVAHVAASEPATDADALRQTAAALGIKVDGRWSVKKLQRVIAEFEAADEATDE
jgi:hypothetical protein